MLFQFNADYLLKIRLMNSATIQPPYIHNRRKADEYIIYVVKKGKMFLLENHIKYTLKPGDFFILDPEFTHEGYQASYCEYYYIHFRHDEITKIEYASDQERIMSIITRRNDSLKSNPFSYTTYENNQIALPKHYHFTNYSDFIKVCCILDEAAAHNANPLENYKVLCSCKILEAMIETYRSYVLFTTQNMASGLPKSYRKVQQLLSHLNTNYADKITSVDIEVMTESNFDYINRIFKQLTNKTIFSYLNMVRINHAKELISTTNMKLSEIGQMVGFSDLYYFSKVFKKATGISPSVFAKGVLK
ncbi:MAG TPA: AraC family transcriptional regulator [Mobilitalea sp.]|nr:AraC family transcriptional regulator [Mobilitalea sp.]